jgi:uncharacterized protein (TIGR02145 family)
MKKLLLFAALLVSALSFSQVGIGTTTPDDSAQLDVTSTTKGLLPPRLTYAQKTAISSPAAGLIVWCTNCGTNGEAQVFNGTTWTNISGTTASFGNPGAPTSPVATAIYKQATVSFTAPVSNGGSAITGYTVTSSPDSFTATGASSPLTITGLTNGTSYTFTVIATNAVGNSVASSASVAVVPNCGAYVSAEVYKVFACYNLGATDTTVDPNTPVQYIHGNYYQWGSNTVSATASTAAGAILSWNTTAAVNGSWSDTSRTLNDPCPIGFKVPTNVQWQGVYGAFNTITRTGSWTNNGNFTTAISFGTSTIKTLTLPAAGFRSFNYGPLSYRGYKGYYWSSTEDGPDAWALYFSSSSAYTTTNDRTYGYSVRCVSE